MEDELSAFTADMFRKGDFESPSIYFIGPHLCGKSTLAHKLVEAGWMSWEPRLFKTFYHRTFLGIPVLKNQYFVLFKDSLLFSCGKERIPEIFHSRVEKLRLYEAVLYDVCNEKMYAIGF